MVVVDASVVFTAVTDDGLDGTRCRLRLTGEPIDAPNLVRIEVLSAIRRHLHAGRLDPVGAQQAVEDLLALPILVHPSNLLLRRAWELSDNVTAYDACCIVLAEALDTPLLNADRKLAGANRPARLAQRQMNAPPQRQTNATTSSHR